MNKHDMRILEQIFEAETHGLPKQFRGGTRAGTSNRLERMAASNLIEHVNQVLPGHPPVSVAGWVLTHYGRRTYRQQRAGKERKQQ